MTDHEFEQLHGFYFDDLKIGMDAKVSKTITDGDVNMYAQISGDVNPLHMDAAFAGRTRTGGRVAHGMLTASLISTIVGTKLPGPGALWMGQTLRFLKPVRIGDTVHALGTIIELISERQRVRLRTICTVSENTVLDGEALLWVPRR